MTEADYLASHDELYSNLDSNNYFKDFSKPKKTINGIKYYKCTKCNKFLQTDNFYKDKRNPCGIRNKCKNCYNKDRSGVNK